MYTEISLYVANCCYSPELTNKCESFIASSWWNSDLWDEPDYLAMVSERRIDCTSHEPLVAHLSGLKMIIQYLPEEKYSTL